MSLRGTKQSRSHILNKHWRRDCHAIARNDKFYNMENFPKLKDGQFAIVRADFNTGIILDDEFKYAINQIQRVYTVVDSLLDAVTLAKAMIIEKGSIECVIYDNVENLASYITPDNVNSI